MFVLEDNKVVFISTDLVTPDRIEEIHSSILSTYPNEKYGCGCDDVVMQVSALPQHIFYSLHHKDKHVLNSICFCPKCSNVLDFSQDENGMHTHKCGVTIDTSCSYIFMWD